MADDPQDVSHNPVTPDPALGSLESRLGAARKAEDARLAADHVPLGTDATRGGNVIAATMLGYPLGGIVIGFVLDKLFGTLPWITIGLMFTAFVGGCIAVMRNNKTRV